MTAISLNLTPALSSDIAGIPLEGLPPFEAGRTLPQDFAELLSKSGNSAEQPPTEGQAEPGEADLAKSGEPGEILPVIAAQPQVPSTALRPLRPTGEQAEPEPAGTGKILPPARPGIAAPDAPAAQVAAESVAIVAPAAQMATEAAAPDGGADPAADAPKSGAAKAAVRDTVDPAAQPIHQAPPQQATVGMPVANATGPDIAIAASAGAAATQAGVSAEIAGQAKGPTRVVASAPGAALPNAAGAALPEEGSPQTGQNPSNMQQGQGNGRQGAQSAPRAVAEQARPSASPPQGAPAQATFAQDVGQAGISLQVRAADKPFADMAPAVQTGTVSNAQGSVLAAPLASQPIIAPTALGAPQAGMPPQFTELAALVDRIEAARASTGSASATISVAHKELGNLALTFEASGRSLAVEVAAQDSETQRSLAAAIAADRPHARAPEAPPQASAPTLQNQLASSAHGGSGDARGSATTGDAQSERRGDPRGSGQQGAPGDDRNNGKPKSDGGIYA